MALGQRLGLSKRMLTELGMAALFHDIGKIEIPPEILNKPTNFTEDEWRIVKRHPAWGARAILRLRGIDKSSLRASIVAFEHHLHHDSKGYPPIKSSITPDIFSEIVTVADQYDAMTSSRVYARVPLQPDRALSLLIERTGTQVNPILVKVLVSLSGIYPQGTLVLLDTKEMGLVFEANPNTELLDRPRVIVVVDSAGNHIKGVTVDLAEKTSTGAYRRSIVRTLDPTAYNINLSEYLL
jgi:HD-GYP domain-containing protein (c-di-GMP phosphodiesterase class II)